MKRGFWARCVAAASLWACLHAVAAEPLPLDAFANLPMVEQVVLSPDGQRFAALVNAGDLTVLAVRDLAGSAALSPLLKTDNRQFRFRWIRWANNERLLVSVAYPSRRGWIDVAETRLISIKRDGSDPVNLVRHSAFDSGSRMAQFQDRVIDWLPEDGHHVLLEYDDDGGGEPSVFKVDVDNGRRQRVHVGRKDVTGWITDSTHRVRVGTRQRGAEIDILLCDPDGSNWRTAWSYGVFARDVVEPMGFGNDVNKLYVTADHEGRRAVFEVDLADPALPRKLLLSHPRLDVNGELMLAPKTHVPVGISTGVFADAGAGIWDAGYKSFVEAIDKALPDRRNVLLQFSEDGSRYVLYSIGNGAPGRYLLGQRDKGELSPLAETYPALLGKPLATKRGYTVTARDGTSLPVLLTLPMGLAPKRLPAVLLPHGGPISMDSYEFDPWVQFLADRGYAVLQVNFRGSAGLGHEHMSAGLKRWGLEMQDDLSDAVNWLTTRGTADPARVCVAGASYGGYAALMGAAKTPDLYRCVISFAGVTDLLDLATHERQFTHGAEVFKVQVGSAWDDRDQLKATSPRRLAAQIKAPVLLIHGTLDRDVPLEQGEDMADALKKAGKRYRFIKQEDGDHQLSNQAHRTQFFREMEAFLAEHLGATPAAEASATKAP